MYFRIRFMSRKFNGDEEHSIFVSNSRNKITLNILLQELQETGYCVPDSSDLESIIIRFDRMG